MDELELMKIAVFKIAEAARRMDALAGAAQTPRGRRLLAAVARLLEVHEQNLRARLTAPDVATKGRAATADDHADEHIRRAATRQADQSSPAFHPLMERAI